MTNGYVPTEHIAPIVLRVAPLLGGVHILIQSTAPHAAVSDGVAPVVKLNAGFAGIEHMVVCPASTGCPEPRAAAVLPPSSRSGS